MDLAARFWSKVKQGGASDCWPWTAYVHPNGYGQFKVGSRSDGTRRAERSHRIAYELANGEIPAGLHVLHTCDNRVCCNPAHLSVGTNADNTRDRDTKGRNAKGERQVDAKLTEAAVRQARRLHGRLTVSALARRYGVSHPTMWKAVHRQTWKHVQ